MYELGLIVWMGVIAGWVIANRIAVHKRPATLALPAALLAFLYAASCGISGDTAEKVVLSGAIFFVLSFAMLAFIASRSSIWAYVLLLSVGTAVLFMGVPFAALAILDRFD